MNFDEFDVKMRQYEQSLDQVITPETYIVARLDGRSFTKLTKEQCDFEKPFDEKFRDIMVNTVNYLMLYSGFKIVYGYTESDEISLLFAFNENTFGRKVRKIISTLSSEASAYFSIQLSKLFDKDLYATFDCRVAPLPNFEKVCDYFNWRQEDAGRNALNAWCYWTLREKDSMSKRMATSVLTGKGNDFKHELLYMHGINYNDLPNWQKRGVGFYFDEKLVKGYNLKEKKEVETTRRILRADYELPKGLDYFTYLTRFKGL